MRKGILCDLAFFGASGHFSRNWPDFSGLLLVVSKDAPHSQILCQNRLLSLSVGSASPFVVFVRTFFI